MLEAAVHEVKSLQRDFNRLRQPVISLLKVFLQIVFGCSCERCESSEHFVKDCTQTPDVDFAIILMAFKDLRSHIKWCSTHSLSEILFHLLGESKISNDNIDVSNESTRLLFFSEFQFVVENRVLLDVLEIDKDVGELQVSMQHVHLVQLLKSLNNLAHEVSSFLLGKFATYLSEFVQVTSVAILREQVEVILSFLDVEKTDHVLALDLAQDAYF